MTIKLNVAALLASGMSRPDVTALRTTLARSGISDLSPSTAINTYQISIITSQIATNTSQTLTNTSQIATNSIQSTQALALMYDEMRNELASLRSLLDLRSRIEQIEDRIA